MTTPVVPQRCSIRRAMALTGLGRAALEGLLRSDTQGYRAIPMAEVARIIGKRVTLEDWDRASRKIEHQGMTR